ncbi:MAG: 23S rRNA (uracil(1939)-C(5))-methyltransferase RlmD [bacterium]|nr:23S rRNA (uracil(1939)-C(5))-methyltransferase RlmD [bacterium]
MVCDKKDIPEILTVKIEKLSNLGYGIAKVDGYVIFVEGACPDDVVKIRVGKKNKNFANATVVEMIEPSSYRVKPFCPMQKVCGACQLQFIDYDYQLKLKKEIVKDTMRSIFNNEVEVRDVIPSPDTKEYRHKIQYPISQTRDSKRILAGYYKPASHEIVNIKYCPIQPEYCDKIIDFIREKAPEFGVSGYIEKQHSGDLKHVVIRSSNYTKENLVILVVNSPRQLDKISKLAHEIYTGLDNIKGVGVNYNPNKTNLIMSGKTEIIEGEAFIEEKLCDKVFKVGADTFFQVNPKSADNIFRYVKKYISENFEKPLILDAYAGITTFGICLSDIAKKVVSVEEVKASVDLATKIVKENNINNVELHNMDAGKFFEKELNTKGRSFDVTVLDPPRKGCTEESLDYALKLTKGKIIYVSCNPATLARDLKYLAAKGCKVEYIQPFDMFCHTYHIENVAIIAV